MLDKMHTAVRKDKDYAKHYSVNEAGKGVCWLEFIASSTATEASFEILASFSGVAGCFRSSVISA